jgi:hypothetical protein
MLRDRDVDRLFNEGALFNWTAISDVAGRKSLTDFTPLTISPSKARGNI